MPFARPSPANIRDRMGAEIAVVLPGADARLRRSMEEVLVRSMAIASHELHGYIEWASAQILPDTAEDEVLARHAAIWGLTRIAATAAIGAVTFTGTAGAIVPANTELRRGDDARYLLAADVTIGGGGTGTGNVTARVAGAAGNAQAGVSLQLVAPVAGVQPSVVVAAGGLGAGVDAESDANLRRTPQQLEALAKLDPQLADPKSARTQYPTPEYARNAHRSIKPEFFVGVGICTHLGCSPGDKLAAGPQPSLPDDWAGGFLCACHGSTFDMAGRVFKNKPAPDNLEVPPHMYLSDTTLVIGEDKKA